MVEPDILVRAGGSFLLAIVGIGALALARGQRAAIALGVFLAAQGIFWTGQNLFAGSAAAGVYWVPLAMLARAVRSIALAILVVEWPARLRDPRLLLLPLGVGVVIALLSFSNAAAPGWHIARAGANVPEPHIAWTSARVTADATNAGLLVALALALVTKFLTSATEDRDVRTRAAWGALLLNLAPLDLGDWLALPGSFWDIARGSPQGSTFLLLGVPLWLLATRRPQGHLAARVAIIMAAFALTGLLVDVAWPADTGVAAHPVSAESHPVENAIVGAQRSAQAFLLAYAIARVRFLGYDLQLRTARRGTLAMGALAALFIVAQIAQQFLSSEYGLLMGGVVAGAFLFAANPLQRAMERLTMGQAHAIAQAQGPTVRVPVRDARSEELFRENLRLVLKDQRVSAEEEQHLAELGERLGIGARRAVELRHEIEREKGVR